jgi:hypothetical protein
MDQFATFNDNFVFALIAVLALMAIFGCAVVALDHWVWATPTRGLTQSKARLS